MGRVLFNAKVYMLFLGLAVSGCKLTDDGLSGKFFDSESSAPLIRILDPSDGSSIAGGIPTTISWDNSLTSGIPTVDLYYSDDNGLTWNLIEAGADNTGSYIWTPPSVESNTYQFRIVFDNAGEEVTVESPIFTVDSTDPTAGTAQTLAPTEGAAFPFTLNAGSDNNTNVTYQIVSGPSHGNVTGCLDNTSSTSCVYTPTGDFDGTDSLTYIVVDEAGNQSAPVTITFNVANGDDDSPTITSLPDRTTNEETAMTQITFTADEGGGVGENNQTVQVSFASSSNTALVDSGEVTISCSDNSSTDGCSGTIDVTPKANQVGSATITVNVSDGNATVQASFILTVNNTNDAPVISDVTNQTTSEDTATNAIAFTINDIDSTLNCSTSVSASSNDATLVPSGNIVFAGTAPNCTLTITPAAHQVGTATLTITVSDGALTDQDSFNLTVTAVDDNPTITSFPDRTTNEDTAMAQISFAADEGGASDENSQSVSVNFASSSNTALVDSGEVTISCSDNSTTDGCSGTIDITPKVNQSGSVTLTFNISDGTNTIQESFTLTVTPVNDDPTITSISNQTTIVDTAIMGIAFTVDEGGLADENSQAVSVSVASSSNTSIIPVGNISISCTDSGDGCSGSLDITPASGQIGTSTITLDITDGTNTVQETFDVIVNPAHPVAVFINPPVTPNILGNHDVEVGGTDIQNYRVAFGPVSTLDCSVEANYSSSIPVSNIWINYPTYSAYYGQLLKFCIVGQDSTSDWQPFTNPTVVTFRKEAMVADFATTSERVVEGAASKSVTVQLDAALSGDVTIYYEVGGTASNPTDHNLSSGSLVIPQGSTQGTIDFDIFDDGSIESEERVTINLMRVDGPGVILGERQNYRLDIEDDDGAAYKTVLDFSVGEVSCILTSDNKLKCWGKNDYGQLGVGAVYANTSSNRPILTNIPTAIDSATDYIVVDSSYYHSCAITSSGQLRCWGKNDRNQVGDGSTSTRSSPVDINAGTNYSMVDVGGEHSCAITTSGVLKCWGYNSHGQLGTGNTSNRSTPTAIDSGTNYIHISTGILHTCGVTDGNILKCWGANFDSQLGDGTTANRSTPTVIDSGTNYIKVAAGSSHSCGITTSGQLKCWGENLQGQLGNGTRVNSATPVIVDSGISYIEVATSNEFTCGITNSNQLKCWGDEILYGVRVLSPVLMNLGVGYKKVKVGSSTVCALTMANSLDCWQIGTVSSLGENLGYVDALTPVESQTSDNFQKVEATEGFACALSNSGQVKCWGAGGSGGLGDGSRVSRDTPTPIADSDSYIDVSVYSGVGCGVTSSNKLKCWGAGQLGLPIGHTQSYVPINIDSGTDYSQIDVGNSVICGITTGNVLKCWGSNFNGAIGNGTTTAQETPIVIDSGTLYTSISAGRQGACGVTTTGALKCWGYNGRGQIGNGSTTHQHSPVVVDSGTNYSKVFRSESNTCAITTAGVLKCWGYNIYALVGNGSSSGTVTSPTVIDSGTSYSDIGFGSEHTCGVTTAGVLKCWGENEMGAIGDGTRTERTTPVVVDSGVSYSEIAAGDYYSCGLTTTGRLKCWGFEKRSLGLGFGLYSPGAIPGLLEP